MPALIAGTHLFSLHWQGVDGRDKPGHDGGMARNERNML
jgi:hypothetical protein